MEKLESYAIKKVAKGGVIIFAAIILSSLAFLFYRIIAARYLGPSDYGMLTLGIVILKITTIFGLLGIHMSIGKFINHYLAKKQYGRAKGLLISSFSVTISFSFLLLLLLYTFSGFMEQNVFRIEGISAVIKIFSFAIPFSVLTQLFYYYFFAFKKPGYVIISESIFEKLANLLFLLLVIFISASVYFLSLGYIISLVISSIAGIILFKSNILAIFKKGIKPLFELKQLISFSFPLMIAGVLGAALAWTDTIFIGIYGSSSDVGIYNAAYLIASSLMIIWLSFGEVFYPIISELYAKRAKTSISRIFEVSSRWIFILVLPIFVFILVFPTRAISLVFGNGFLEANLPLLILIVGYFFITISGLTDQGLRTFKKTRFIGVSTFISFLMNILLNFLLVPPYGMVGAAIATSITIITFSIIRIVVFKKILSFNYELNLYFRYIFLAIISFFLVFSIFKLLNLFSTFFFIIAIMLYLMSYFALIIFSKSFSKEDIMVLQALERKLGISIPFLKLLLNNN